MPAGQINVKMNEVKFVMAYLFGDYAYTKEAEMRKEFGPQRIYTGNVIGDETVLAVLSSDEDCEGCAMKEVCEKMERNPAYKGMLEGVEVGGLYTVAELKRKYLDGLGKMSLDTYLFKMAPADPAPSG